MPVPPGLDTDAEAEIRRHGAETYPNGDRIIEAFRLPNTTAEGARRRFMIGPEDYRLAEARARERRGTLAGFYHSHPDHPARPSQTDLAQAWPNLTYIIVAVREGTPEDLKSWRLLEDRSGFKEI
jgi:proteasome lid subunit RPN8/RPN11